MPTPSQISSRKTSFNRISEPQMVNRIAKSVNRKPDRSELATPAVEGALRVNPLDAVVFESAFLLTTPDAIFVHSIRHDRSVYVSGHPVSRSNVSFQCGFIDGLV